jgi:hypothetical protein
MVAACERLAIDTEALLRAAGISRQTLEDPDARLEASKVSALWTKAYELSGDPVLSLHAAEACPLGAYKVIDYMASNAATVGEAFCYSSRYFPLVNTAIRLPIDESGDPVTFDVVDESGPAGVSRPYAEYCFAAFVLHVRAGTGVSFPLQRITFVHAAPPDVTEHQRIFGCPVRFGTEHNRLYIDRRAWETPAAEAHPGVLQVLTEHADLLLQKLPRGPDLVERTRRAIGERLRGGARTQSQRAKPAAALARSRLLVQRPGRRGQSRNRPALPRAARHRDRGGCLPARVRGPERLQPRLQALDGLHACPFSRRVSCCHRPQRLVPPLLYARPPARRQPRARAMRSRARARTAAVRALNRRSADRRTSRSRS